MTSSAVNPVDAQVFISYAQDEDGSRALEVADHLEAAGVSVWIADRSIDGAQNYGPEVVAAIDRCQVLVVLCSEASVHSEHVAVEVELAFEAKRPRLPLRLDDTPFPDQIRYWLTGSNWIDVRGPAEDWIPKVLRSLERHGVECRAPAPASGGPSAGARVAPLQVSEVQYAKTSDDAHVAYRIIEAEQSCAPGPDVVMVSGGLFPMELFEADPGLAALLDGLRAIGRVIVFDRRGVGMSDPVADWDRPVLDQWAEDLRAVVHASGALSPVVFGWDSYGVATRFAARHPDALDLLVLHHPCLVDDDRWATWVDERTAQLRWNLGGEQDLLEVIAPSRVDDQTFRDWYLRAGRAGASPTTAGRIWASIFESPPSEQLLDHVSTPTLVLCRRDARYVPAELSRAAARQIDRATVVELGGADHFPFLSDVDSVVAAIRDFVASALPAPQHTLGALLGCQLVDSGSGGPNEDASAGSHGRLAEGVRAAVADCGGEVVSSTGDTVVAVLPSAFAVVRAARRARDDLVARGLAVRFGVHIGDVDRRDDAVTGPGVTVVQHVTTAAEPGQVVATASVPVGAPGHITGVTSLGSRSLVGLPGQWELFAL